MLAHGPDVGGQSHGGPGDRVVKVGRCRDTTREIRERNAETAVFFFVNERDSMGHVSLLAPVPRTTGFHEWKTSIHKEPIKHMASR